MTILKAAEVLFFYRDYLKKEKSVAHTEQPNYDDPSSYQHLYYMIFKCLTHHIVYKEDNKVMRWLGFIQGVLLCKKDFTLE